MDKAGQVSMEAIVSLCRRRGFIFQSSEIYGGLNGFFDYGPLGVELRNNIKQAWWRDMVQSREDMVGLDSSIIAHPRVWKASGHIEGFSDPMVDCRVSKMRYRADQLFFAPVVVEGRVLGYVSVLEDVDMQAQAEEAANKLKRKLAVQGSLEALVLQPYAESRPEQWALVPSPATGEPGSLTAPRAFNLMFETHVGALQDAASVAYLRPETAQGIFINFRNVLDSTRIKLPFGIAQIGKAFRNEITPRNFIFRSREFEQMEIEYFIPLGEETWRKAHAEWIQTRRRWLESMGLDPKRLKEQAHPQEKLAHYACACTDILFDFPFGTQELEGIAARGNYDLTQHSTHSGKNLEYHDEVTGERFLPQVIEPSLGVDRMLLAVLCSAYSTDVIDGEERQFLRLHPRLAPIKVGIFPLVKNKPELVQKAREYYERLNRRWNVFYDASGAIGRRYRRMDEIGTPFCITIDYQTLEDQSVTLRHRDSAVQQRMGMEGVMAVVGEAV